MVKKTNQADNIITNKDQEVDQQKQQKRKNLQKNLKKHRKLKKLRILINQFLQGIKPQLVYQEAM